MGSQALTGAMQAYFHGADAHIHCLGDLICLHSFSIKQPQAGELIHREEPLGLPPDCFLVFGFDQRTKRRFVYRKVDLLGLRFQFAVIANGQAL